MNIEVWNKLFEVGFLRKNNIRCVHRIIEDSIFDFNVRILADRISLVPNVTLYYNIRESSILTKIFEKEGTHESAFVFCDIIKQCQDLIRTKYHAIDGIYDLYYLRIEFSVASLMRSHYSDLDKNQIRQCFRGVGGFVPSVNCLKLWKYRVANIFMRFCDNYVACQMFVTISRHFGLLKKIFFR